MVRGEDELYLSDIRAVVYSCCLVACVVSSVVYKLVFRKRDINYSAPGLDWDASPV